MKKYLSLALAMPLLFACSNDLDVIEEVKVNNDPFAGIEKVDATFTMADQPITRMDNKWGNENGDRWGFAWLTDAKNPTPVLELNGNAYQNHPLNVKNGAFKPETSIYVGKYYLYRPYDETTVDIQAINFNSLVEQPLTDGQTGEHWSALAKNAINIGDKWTSVTLTGEEDTNGKIWDKAGIDQNYKLYAATFSNQTGLDLTYEKNNPGFEADKAIKGASDIEFTIPEGTEAGAADIYEATVELNGAAKSFTYAPTNEPNSGTHSGAYWADKKNLGASIGFGFTSGAITLKAANENGVSTKEGKGWFWFNSLPKTAGDAVATTTVETTLTTSYGVVTINSGNKLSDIAYAYEPVNGTGAYDANGTYKWIKLADADNVSDQNNLKWNADASSHNTFVNQYGNHTGKYALTVDFSNGVMNGMHIKNDEHLQKLLKYYIAADKTEVVSLNLDGASATDKTFKLSKISIALLQTINASTNKVTLHACASHNNPVKIIITQDGQEELDLENSKEVPALDKLFDATTQVYLSAGCEWTWSSADALKTDNVSLITNEGTLTVNSTNVQAISSGCNLANAKDAIMNITKVTTVKSNLTNLGTINVPAEAELRAYDAEITNDATSLTAYGVINNYGVVGVTLGTTGKVNNYGYINMMNGDAITLLTSNEISGANFDDEFNATTNKLGTVVLPENNPCAIVSVSNATETGFIKYNWDGGTYATPEGIIKYNTIVVNADIEFTETEAEIQFIEFTGNKTKVVNKSGANKLTKLKGIIVDDNCSIIIEKTNVINCLKDAYLGEGATVYNGGKFLKNGVAFTSGTVVNYLGEWSTDQVVVY